MSWFSRLFGKGDADAPADTAITYEGFRIIADPAKEGQQWRIGARIEREVDGELKVHQMIRADLLGARDAAVEASVAKAKQMIDEQGVRLFN